MKRKRMYGTKYDHMLSDIQANKTAMRTKKELHNYIEETFNSINYEQILRDISQYREGQEDYR